MSGKKIAAVLAFIGTLAAGVNAGAAQVIAGSEPTIYVGDFVPVDNAEGNGLLGGVASSMHTRTVNRDAEKFSDAIVAALNDRHVVAARLPDAIPAQGWIVRGVFQSLDKSTHLISLPFSKQKGPNVEVSVTIADAAKDPNTPFAVVGSDAALKGQGNALSWNPYIIGAKLVYKSVEGSKSLDALAGQIADKILQNQSALGQHS
jgi:hypothetical protein